MRNIRRANIFRMIALGGLGVLAVGPTRAQTPLNNPVSLTVDDTTIAYEEGNRGRLLGAIDLYGNGAYDLVLGHEAIVPYLGHGPDGVPQYGPTESLSAPKLIDPLAGDSSLFLGVPFASADAYYARIAISAGRVHTYENNDHIDFEVVFNDGAVATLGSFRGNATNASGALALDHDGDGVGDGTPIDVAFRSYTFPVPAGEWPISLRVKIDTDGNEELGVDAVELIAATGSRTESLAHCGFNTDAAGWAFETNINGASVSSTTEEYNGATFAGDSFNDYVGVVPLHDNLYSSQNIDLGFNNWEGDGYLIAEDTGQDGMPGEVTLTFDPIALEALPTAYSGGRTSFDAAYLSAGTPEMGGGLALDPAGESRGLALIADGELQSTARTWMAWIYVNQYETGGFSTTHPHGIMNGFSGSTMSEVFRISSGQLQAGWYDGERYVLSTTDQTIPTGEWLHVSATSDGTNAARIFVNGVEWDSTVSSGDPSSRPFGIGEVRVGYQSPSGNIRVLDGSIRDARLYGREVSQAELAQVAAAGPNAMAYVSLDEIKPGAIIETNDDRLISLSSVGSSVFAMEFNEAENRFEELARYSVPGSLPINSLGARVATGGAIDLYLSQRGEADYLPHGKPLYDEDFIPYDGSGTWLGGSPEDNVLYAQLDLSSNSRNLVSNTITENARKVPFEATGLTAASTLGETGVIAGGVLGMLYYYPEGEAGESVSERQYLWLENGDLLLHPGGNARPVAVTNSANGFSDIVVQSDAGMLFYKSAGTVNGRGEPVYSGPEVLTQTKGYLTFGEGAAITGGDLNNDGLYDLVSGNAAGELLVSYQTGPMTFAPPVALTVGNGAYRYEAGYRGSLQGPAQARLGHTAPTLYDWTGDGALDLILSNISGDYYILERKSSEEGVVFDKPRPLFVDGLELHAAWRTQPAVTEWDGAGAMTLVTLDENDRVTAYRKYDNHNLFQGEPLLLEDGSEIVANAYFSSGTGRIRLHIFDWDGDGALDLLVGTTPQTSLPNPTEGLPLNSTDLREATVLFLKNVGTNGAPTFANPVAIATKTEASGVQLGSVSGSPFAPGSGAALLVARSNGVVQFFPPSGTSTGLLIY